MWVRCRCQVSVTSVTAARAECEATMDWQPDVVAWEAVVAG